MREKWGEGRKRKRSNGLYLSRLVYTQVGRLVNTVADLHHEVSFGDGQALGGKFTQRTTRHNVM